MKSIIIALAIATALSTAAPALAQDRPIWDQPTAAVNVVEVGSINGFAYAKIRDNGMRGHNVYCIAVGAHLGKATVTKISGSSIELSDGRILQADTTVAQR